MMIGDACKYRSLNGDVYDAVVSGHPGPEGVVTLDVTVPGCESMVTLTCHQGEDGMFVLGN
jgi:hypothetical protein